VVSYTEADHAATADEVIESCQLARRAIENALRGAPDLTADPRVQARRAELVQQAQITLAAIAAIADREAEDPLIDPATLARAVQVGILDAPQLRNNRFAPGAITTRCTAAGACVAVDSAGRPLPEQDRLAHLLKGH